MLGVQVPPGLPFNFRGELDYRVICSSYGTYPGRPRGALIFVGGDSRGIIRLNAKSDAESSKVSDGKTKGSYRKGETLLK